MNPCALLFISVDLNINSTERPADKLTVDEVFVILALAPNVKMPLFAELKVALLIVPLFPLPLASYQIELGVKVPLLVNVCIVYPATVDTVPPVAF